MENLSVTGSSTGTGQLNEAQMRAVTSTEGFIRVLAGAGSGKTRALTRRFAYLVNELGILPGNILCVTFTNKAAAEMRQRIHNLTGDQDTGYINTFHGFCVAVLQEDSHAVQYPKSFLVLDNSDINDMLDVIYRERGLTLRDMKYSDARDMIEIMKCRDRQDYYEDMLSMSTEALKEKYLSSKTTSEIIFYGYLYQEKKCFGLDYNDLIIFTLYIFKENPEIREKWQKRLEYIMIDEFQDIDALQYRLMKVLCGYHGNLFAVGDPDQTIYTWRGADVAYLLNFPKEFPGAETIMMMENYRSAPQILRAVNSLIANNRNRVRKELIPMLPEGEDVICHMAPSPAEEAGWIADRIRSLTADGQVKKKDIAVLYRAHYVTRQIEDVFIKEKIPYTIYSGVQFYERKEIKDAISYLRMIAFKDDLSFRRICNEPKRNIGKSRMEFLTAYAGSHGCTLYQALTDTLGDDIFKGTKADRFVSMIEKLAGSYEGMDVSEVLTKVLGMSGYEEMLRTEGAQDRLDNLAELKQSIHEFEMTCGEELVLERYLREVALFSNQDADTGSDRVRLMTVHAAKGLEFPYVFLCGMNEGIFPSRKISTEAGMEEERRLAYVAMTRAEKQLFLTEAEGRSFDGTVRYPSRFLLDIDPDLLSFTGELDEGLIKATREYVRNQSRFYSDAGDRLSVGTKVRHSVFGQGEITDVDNSGGAYTIRFENTMTERKISFRINLEVVGQ